MDLEVVMTHLKKNFKYRQLGLYGKSLGAIVSLKYAAQSFDVNFLILDSLLHDFKVGLQRILHNEESNWFYKAIVSIGVDYLANQVKLNHKLDINNVKIKESCS